MTVKQMASGVKRLAAGWSYDAVSIGYPHEHCFVPLIRRPEWRALKPHCKNDAQHSFRLL
jgi:hypothetical protein